MRNRVSAALIMLMLAPTLMGCFGNNEPEEPPIIHPFGFDEAIPNGVWYHFGGSAESQNATNLLNASAMEARGFSPEMLNGSNIPFWANGTYYGTGFDVDKHAIFGPAEEVTKRLREQVDAGITHLMLGVPTLDHTHLRRLAQEVVPALRV
jgi:alkanesulfonate monooxygenase SsuD/methylene tetrahydromethanopterin reductase-like flavin-dependent oxidoreductase (luciferase family)